MDYSKFLKHGKKEYIFNVENKYMKESMQILKDIERSEFILNNYTKFDYKIDIDEYFAYFLKEKNAFINLFQLYINGMKNKKENDLIKLYDNVLILLKKRMEDLITNFKIVKQKIYKKNRKQEMFDDKKLKFFMKQESQGKNLNKINTKKNIKKPINFNLELLNEKENVIDNYKESNTVMSLFYDKKTQNYEKTKKIIFELSDLMNTVQKKINEQGEMTKNILFNSIKSVDNVEEGNKQLEKAKKYQKGRGFTIGLIFFIMGLYLIIIDR